MWFEAFYTLGGGLALFFMGISHLKTGMRSLAGQGLKNALASMARNRVVGLLSGMVVTGITNSLTFTSLLLVNFVATDILRFEQTLGVLLGAGIGSTFIGILIVFKVTKYGLLMIAVGYALTCAKPKPDGLESRKVHCGMLLMGLGLVFFGGNLMGDAFAFLQSYRPFLDLLVSMDHPVLGMVFSIGFTALLNSSGVAMTVYISLCKQGLLTQSAAGAMMLGSNIGTCLTAVLAAMGQGTEAKRVAAALLLARVLGAIITLVFLQHFLALTSLVCHCGLPYGTIGDPAEIANHVAMAHVLFNVALAAGLLPFTSQYTRLICYLVPQSPTEPQRHRSDESYEPEGQTAGGVELSDIKRNASGSSLAEKY